MDRPSIQIERVGNLFGGQSGEIAQFDNSCRTRADYVESDECLVERQRLVCRAHDQPDVLRVQRLSVPVTASPQPQAIPRSITQHVSHRARRIRKELRRSFEVETAAALHAKVQLVHQRRGLLGGALHDPLAARHGLEAPVDLLEERIHPS